MSAQEGGNTCSKREQWKSSRLGYKGISSIKKPTSVRFCEDWKRDEDGVDQLPKHNIEDAIVCGILVNGYGVSTCSMRLVSDAVYLMGLHGTFHRLRRSQEPSSVPRIWEYFHQVKKYP